jgi:hypothetical protein
MSKKEALWTEEVNIIQEDRVLLEYVLENKNHKWTKIARVLHEAYGLRKHSAIDCRNRWHNHLDPAIKKEIWTVEEKQQIISLHEKLGNRWSKIAKWLPGRTDNSVKNCYYALIRKNIRNYNRNRLEKEKLKSSIRILLKNVELRKILLNCEEDATIQEKRENEVKFK